MVRIDFYGHVHKTFRGTDKEARCKNEVHILKALEERKCPFVPQLLDYRLEDDWIKTTSCGSPAPDVSRKKADSLFAKLESEYGVRHDDPEPRNITYDEKAGQFCVIDFELATLLPLPSSSASDE